MKRLLARSFNLTNPVYLRLLSPDQWPKFIDLQQVYSRLVSLYDMEANHPNDKADLNDFPIQFCQMYSIPIAKKMVRMRPSVRFLDWFAKGFMERKLTEKEIKTLMKSVSDIDAKTVNEKISFLNSATHKYRRDINGVSFFTRTGAI